MTGPAQPAPGPLSAPLTRRQLTLFVPPPAAGPLERVRQTLDPVQRSLIPVHVTLGRETEIGRLTEQDLRACFSGPTLRLLTLTFGAPEAFSGHGIRIQCTAGLADFHALRSRVLRRPADHAPTAHITLAHPRNPRAEGNSMAAAATVAAGLTLTFDAVALIEQTDARPWRVLASCPLRW